MDCHEADNFGVRIVERGERFALSDGLEVPEAVGQLEGGEFGISSCKHEQFAGIGDILFTSGFGAKVGKIGRALEGLIDDFVGTEPVTKGADLGEPAQEFLNLGFVRIERVFKFSQVVEDVLRLTKKNDGVKTEANVGAMQEAGEVVITGGVDTAGEEVGHVASFHSGEEGVGGASGFGGNFLCGKKGLDLPHGAAALGQDHDVLKLCPFFDHLVDEIRGSGSGGSGF